MARSAWQAARLAQQFGEGVLGQAGLGGVWGGPYSWPPEEVELLSSRCLGFSGLQFEVVLEEVPATKNSCSAWGPS